MKTFLTSDRPIITGMLKSKDKKGILAEIQRIRVDGAEAYGLQIDSLEDECKQPHHLKEIFDARAHDFTKYASRVQCLAQCTQWVLHNIF